jgi:hypothetical protein
VDVGPCEFFPHYIARSWPLAATSWNLDGQVASDTSDY